MFKKLKKNLLNIPQKVNIDHSQDNLCQNLPKILCNNNTKNTSDNKIVIPKFSLDERKINSYKFIQGKKRVNSLGKITSYNYDNYSKRDYSLFFVPKNQDLINYYYKKNQKDIDNIINNYQNKIIKTKKITKIKSTNLINNTDKKEDDTNVIKVKHTRKKMNKSTSFPEHQKKNKNLIESILNSISNKDNDTTDINELEKNFRKTKKFCRNIFSKDQLKNNNNEILISLRNYIEDKKKERNYLCILINNSNKNLENLNNIYKKINIKQKKIFPYKYKNNLSYQKRLLQEKKIDNDTLEIISNESDFVKSFLEPKFIKKEEEFNNRLLRKKIKEEKIDNNNEMTKYMYKRKINNNIVVENQIKLIKNKLENNGSYSYLNNDELKNSFKSHLFLSISNPYEQLINTRSFGKIIEDVAFLKELHNKEKIKLKK